MTDYIALVKAAAAKRVAEGGEILSNCGIGGYRYNKIPVPVQEVIKASVGKYSLSEYPDARGLPTARRALIEYHQRVLNVDLGESDACLTNGGRNALFKIMETFLRPGDKVFLPLPGYGGQFLAVQAQGAVPIGIPCGPGIDYAAGVRNAISKDGHKPAIIVFDSINNPSGEQVTQDQLEQLADVAADPAIDALLVEDAVYREVTIDGPPALSMQNISRARPHLLTVTSGSKNYGLAGLRIGGILGHIKLIDRIDEHKKVSNYGPCVLAQYAYETAFNECADYIELMRAEMKRRRDFICDEFGKLGWKVSKPSAGIFILTECPQQDALDFCVSAARQAGWVFYPARAFAFGNNVSQFNNQLRIAMMEPRTRMKAGLPSLKAFLGK